LSSNGLQTQYKKAADALVSSTNFVIWYYVTDTDLTHLICFVGVLPLNLMLTVTNAKETAHFLTLLLIAEGTTEEAS